MSKGVEIRGKTLRVYFNYKGDKCREKLTHDATPENIAYAERMVAQIEHEIRGGTFDYARYFPQSTRLQKSTFGHYLDLWLSLKKNQVADSTFRSWSSYCAQHIRPRWGSHQPQLIEHLALQEWVFHDLLAKLSSKTGKEIVAIMRGVYALWGKQNNSTHNPTDDITIKLPDPDDPDPFTRSEIVQILSTPTARPQELRLIEFMIWTGPRVSEAIALAWEDVELERGLVHFRRAKVYQGGYKVPKTKKSDREVELLKPALEALKAQWEITGHLPAQVIQVKQRDNRTIREQRVRFVFLRDTTGDAIPDDKRLRDQFFTAHLEKAEVRHRGPGQCRHTFASQMLTAGMPIEWIVKQMGHTTTEMIRRRYAKWITEDAPDMVSIAEARLGLR